jgi:hypothetical protein
VIAVADVKIFSNFPLVNDDERLVRLRSEQAATWKLDLDPWAIIPFGDQRFAALAGSWEGVRRLIEVTRAAFGPIDAPTFNDFSVDFDDKSVIRSLMHFPDDRYQRILEMVELIVFSRSRTPRSVFQHIDPLSVLLREFFLSLEAKDQKYAREILLRIRENGRLRLQNLVFLEIQLDAAFQRWSDIRSRQDFEVLCSMSPPALIASILIECLWRTDLRDVTGDDINPKDVRNEFVRQGLDSKFDGLFRNISTPDRSAARRLQAVHIGIRGEQTRLEHLVGRFPFEADELRLWAGFESETHEVKVRVDRLTELRTHGDYLGVINYVLNEDPSTANILIAVEAVLEIRDRPLAGQIQDLMITSNFEIPSTRFATVLIAEFQKLLSDEQVGWIEWANQLVGSKASFFEPYFQSKAQWPIDWLDDFELTSLFGQRLVEAMDAGCSERVETALADLVKLAESGKSRQFVGELRFQLVYVMMELAPNSAPARDLALDLVETSLAHKCEKSQYQDLLEFLLATWSRVASAFTLPWILEVVSTLDSYPQYDANSLKKFKTAVGESIYRFAKNLDHIWLSESREVLGDFAPQVSVDVPQDAKRNLWLSLSGKRIGIYSLNPGLARIKTQIEELVPNVVVRINSETDFSDELKALLRNSDVILVQTRRATHAATENMRRYGEDRIRFAGGRSNSGILRALESFASELV